LEFARSRPQGQLLDELSMPNDLALGPVDSGRLRVFSGSSNPALAKDIAMSLGMPLGGITIKRFADGEVYVQLQVAHSPHPCDALIHVGSCHSVAVDSF
jgi:hypothetical protein